MVRTLPRESNFQKRETAELVPYLGPEAIIATGHGMNLGIALSESVLFLERYDKEDPSTKKCTILRGQLRLSVTKPTRLKKVWIRFCGQMQMVWPGADCMSTKTLFTQGITYFDRGGTAMHRNDFGADSFDLLKAPTATANAHLMTTTNASLQVGQPGASKVCLTQTGYSVEDTATCHSKSNEAQSQSGSKLFPAGDFLYSFEFLLDGSLPETIKTDLSSIQYSLEAFVEPSRHLRSNLTGKLEIPVVRLPAESPLELTEPVMISGNWRDQLHYRMVMSGKSFPLGSQIPISLKLTPMSKVACQWVKVYVTEHVQHWSRGKEAGLLQIPSKKVLLFENQAGLESVSTYPGSEMRIISSNSRDGSVKLPLENSSKTNLLGGSMSSDTGIELNVQLPSCFEMKDREKSQCLCLDSKNEILTVSHWIQVVLRLSTTENNNRSWNRPVEVTLQSPFRIMSCKATPANIYLPTYAVRNDDPMSAVQRGGCDCSGYELSVLGSSALETAAQPQNKYPHVDPISSKTSTMSFHFCKAGIQPPPQAHIREKNHCVCPFPPLFRPLSSAQDTLEEIELQPLPPPPPPTPHIV